MKKLVVIIFALSLLMLSACSNADRRLDKKVHIIATGKDIEIQDRYTLYNSGANVKLKNGKRIFFSNGTYIIFDGKCPICESEETNDE